MTRSEVLRRYSIIKVVGILLIVVAILWCVVGIKVNAAEKAENDRVEYQLQENQFKQEVRECMENMGYFNSGITVTKIMNEDGSREYSVRVHNQYLNMDDCDKVDEIYDTLSDVQMVGDNITVEYTIFQADFTKNWYYFLQ